MAKLTIAGIAPFDGDYDLDIGTFTNRELHTIKQISGVRAGEFKEATQAGDNDLLVAFTVIVLQRAGKKVEADQIWDADLGTVTITPDAAVVEERPLTSAPPNGSANSSGGGESESENTDSSGPDSLSDGDSQVIALKRTGDLGSDNTSLSDLATSVN